jgi:hypothetical protein
MIKRIMILMKQKNSYRHEDLTRIWKNDRRTREKKNEIKGRKLQEVEIVSLINEVEKTTDQLNIRLKFRKSTGILDNIISFQRSSFIKKGLGYDEKQNKTKGYASTRVTKPS